MDALQQCCVSSSPGELQGLVPTCSIVLFYERGCQREHCWLSVFLNNLGWSQVHKGEIAELYTG